MAAKPTRIAIDLTLLLDLAANDATSFEGLVAAKRSFKSAEIIVSPVTRQSLALAVTSPLYDAETQSLALAALERIEKKWKFTSPEIDGASLGVCDENAKLLISSGLLGGHAWSSAHTIAEAACLDCSLLLCHDSELIDIDYSKLKATLKQMDREPLWVTTPGEILRQKS